MSNNKPYPLLPLLNTVVYPKLNMPLVVGRPASLAALQASQENESDQRMVVIAQKNTEEDRPDWDDLYQIGTLVRIRQIEPASSNMHVLVQGLSRIVISKQLQTDPYLAAQVKILPELESDDPGIDDLAGANQQVAREIAQVMNSENSMEDYKRQIDSIKNPLIQAYRMASLASLNLSDQQQLLEMDDFSELLLAVHKILLREQRIIRVRLEIASKTKADIDKHQRETVLRHQKRAIEDALGEKSPSDTEIGELLENLEAVEGLPENVRKEALRELKRMGHMSPGMADFQIAYSYIEFIIELPWGKHTTDHLDLVAAARVLSDDHFGLEDVKERILEHLAVMQMNPAAKPSILCFCGPPGVGKTSLGRSVARTLGRKFERLSLGGLHDEGELRGHRRTYVGAMPGRILQTIRRAGVNNPLIMLDEIDKLGQGFRGDPASVLMEVLDPVQNVTFRDNYLDLPFDISKVFFITTANSLERVPLPLRDRMEVIELSGYADHEKEQIAKRYLIQRQQKEAGLSKKQLRITPAALKELIAKYTREAGVRDLERAIARLARKQVRRFLEGKKVSTISLAALAELLGPSKFLPEQIRKKARVGVVAGLAWTAAGGDVLYVEAALIAKKERLHLTGQLGDIMQESAYAAKSYLWSVASGLGIDRQVIEENGLHIHVPAGSVPKDGPSAGVTIATALASAYSGHMVIEGVAMTGEITLAGLVLPVGGIKEKMLAAHRAGLKKVLLPKANENDLLKLPTPVQKDMEFVFVENLTDLLETAIPKLHFDRTAET